MRSIHWQFWLGVGVSILLLLVLIYQVDLAEMRDALADANYLYVIPAIGLYFIAVFFRAVRWRYLLSPLKIIPTSRLYPVVVIGYMANNLLPARLGELVRAYYLARREPVTGSSALATVAVERVYDGLTLLAWVGVAGPVLFLLGEFDGSSDTSRTTWIVLAAVTAVLFIGALVVLTVLAGMQQYDRFLDVTTRIVPARFRPKVRELAEAFVQGLSILNTPRKHLSLFLLSLPVWALEASDVFPCQLFLWHRRPLWFLGSFGAGDSLANCHLQSGDIGSQLYWRYRPFRSSSPANVDSVRNRRLGGRGLRWILTPGCVVVAG